MNLFNKLNLPKSIGVAVSGGPDSIALLYLLSTFINKSDINVLSITIDHKLRPTSTQEANNVAQFSESLGVPHTILTIPWSTDGFPPYPSPHVTEGPARQARIILFRRFMNQNGIDTLLMGHHRGDQIENKLTRGHGMKCLARMDGRDSSGKPKWIVRPLLGVDKSELLEICARFRLPYVIDPTNFNPLHTPRNALRQLIQAYQTQHVDHPHLVASRDSTGGPLVGLKRSIRNDAKPSSFSLDLQILIDLRAIQLHAPALGTLIMRPSHFPASLRPSTLSALLLKLVQFIGPPNACLTASALDDTKFKIFHPLAINKRFTPGGGIVFTPKSNHWIVSRQRFRSNNAANQVELTRVVEDVATDSNDSEGWDQWDGRFWIKLIKKNRDGTRYFIQSQGQWCTPLIIAIDQDSISTVILDIAAHSLDGKGESPRGKWSNGNLTIHWRFANSID